MPWLQAKSKGKASSAAAAAAAAAAAHTINGGDSDDEVYAAAAAADAEGMQYDANDNPIVSGGLLLGEQL